MKMTLSKENEILLGGFYTNKSRKRINGVFYGIWKFEDQKPSLSFHPFSKSFATKRENWNFMSYYRITHLNKASADKLLFIGEQYKTRAEPSGNYKTNMIHIYGNILYFEFDFLEKVALRKGKIRKHQEFDNSNGVPRDFYFQEVNNEFWFLYNNHPKNLHNLDANPKEPGGLLGWKNLVTLAIIENNANQKISSFLNEKPSFNNKIPLLKVYKLTNNEAVLVRKQRKQIQLIKYTFENSDSE